MKAMNTKPSHQTAWSNTVHGSFYQGYAHDTLTIYNTFWRDNHMSQRNVWVVRYHYLAFWGRYKCRHSRDNIFQIISYHKNTIHFSLILHGVSFLTVQLTTRWHRCRWRLRAEQARNHCQNKGWSDRLTHAGVNRSQWVNYAYMVHRNV